MARGRHEHPPRSPGAGSSSARLMVTTAKPGDWPAEGVLAAVGNTPLVRLARVFPNARFNLYAKLEGLNPGGSIKDRPARKIVSDALASGLLKPGMVVVESSSGNFAIGLAQACAYHGLRLICVVDPKMTAQNIAILRAYGATIEMVAERDPATGEFLPARLARVRDLLDDLPDAFWPNQYANRGNSAAHHQTMREIAGGLRDRVDYLFCSTSTCGTLRGCSEYVRARRMQTQVVAVDALGSVIFGSPPARRLIPGHGAAIRPPLYHPSLADRVIHISDLECISACRGVIQREAILAGGSSGAVISAVYRLISEIIPGSNCVAIFPDRGERYLETIYSDDWVRENFGEIPAPLGTVGAEQLAQA